MIFGVVTAIVVGILAAIHHTGVGMGHHGDTAIRTLPAEQTQHAP
jgi:hypothetical protein